METEKSIFLQGGKYELIKVLGIGGFGITYLGIQRNLNRYVAVKEFFMKDFCQHNDEHTMVTTEVENAKKIVELYLRKFIKEAHIIASFNNPGIIRIMDIFAENGTAYYVMEYLEGGDLAKRIPANGMDEETAKKYIIRIAESMAYIHKNKFLHLDIKPQNILFNNQDEPVLIDFGIAKHYDEDKGNETSTTPPGLSKGYAPMEQYEPGGVREFAPATDIYSLGATFYSLLVGKCPPSASDVFNYGLPALPTKVSSHTAGIVKWCMTPKRDDRPQSIEEFLAKLNENSSQQQGNQNKEEEKKIKPNTNEGKKKKKEDGDKPKKKRWAYVLILVVALTGFFVIQECQDKDGKIEKENKEIVSSDNSGKDIIEETKIEPEVIVEEAVKVEENQAVDLGLSVKWAKQNLVADGYAYFAWGETGGKTEYSIGTSLSYDKDVQFGDAARTVLGNGWRVPTEKEMQELIDKCTWTWMTVDGKQGYKVTGRNGNSIFLPAEGHMHNRSQTSTEEGFYQTSQGMSNRGCRILRFSQEYKKLDFCMRYQGNSIRPVKELPDSTKIINTSTVFGELKDACDFYNKKEYSKALPIFVKYAQQGNAVAQLALGECYYYGHGLEFWDYTKAVEWYTKAAQQGNADAQYTLGICYKRGIGVPVDLEKAEEWYSKAAQQEDKYAVEP